MHAFLVMRVDLLDLHLFFFFLPSFSLPGEINMIGELATP